MRHSALVDLQHRALVVFDGKAAAASPRVTAHMLAGGAMETMLQQLESSGAQGAAPLGAPDGSLAGLLADAYQALEVASPAHQQQQQQKYCATRRIQQLAG
ncbi:hypothetical protein D9Q98_007045 [Chlorella vulgaris]|uniref:Uncharacterized protein n=1 Tax=Chlorella vulgaris TaxID=3077 RepID=A0A9D4TJD4_CHLVU|nr:hypothetical protein D9Q98_007045 [Chlorella vulgaris]